MRKFFPGVSASEMIRRGMVFNTSFEGNCNDNVGSNNGISSSVVYSIGNGYIQQGAGFFNSQIQLPQPIPSGNDFTISFWVNPHVGFNFLYMCLVADIGSFQGVFYQYLTRQITVRSFGIDHFNLTPLTLNSWQQITVTNGSSGLRIYFNGFLDSPVYPQFPSFIIEIFGGHLGADNFNGAMDIMSIWNRELSPSEVFQYFSLSSVSQYPF